MAQEETSVLWDTRALKDGDIVEEKEALEDPLTEALDEPDELAQALAEGCDDVDSSALTL